MLVSNRDQILALKEERRKQIKELKKHYKGDCIHLGKISRGCIACFDRTSYDQFAIYTGAECNANCPYCYYDPDRNDVTMGSFENIQKNLTDLYYLILDPKMDLKSVSYNSFGEPLKYLSVIEEASYLIKRAEGILKRKIYSHLYTNGILATKEVLQSLKDWGITELRFHMSASNFSKLVMDHMVMAKSMGFIVTVEEPALLENKEALLKLLPWFEEIGLDHLDIIEIQVTEHNFNKLHQMYPHGRIYRDFLWHLYDEGMVYDIMEEMINQNYSFSIIDCNSRVECCRDSKQNSIPGLNDNINDVGVCKEFI